MNTRWPKKQSGKIISIRKSKKALDLKNQIDTTDKKIDKLVYELYGLSEEEILIIEEK